MKAFKYITFVLVALVTLTFTACNDDDYSVGEPFDKVKGTIGNWTVKSVTLVNENGEEMDITSYFGFSDYNIRLNQDQSFTISGTAPNYVGVNSGTWKLDNDDTPMYLQLTEGNTTSQFAFVAPPREGTNLRIRYERKAGDDVIASYVYELTKEANATN